MRGYGMIQKDHSEQDKQYSAHRKTFSKTVLTIPGSVTGMHHLRNFLTVRQLLNGRAHCVVRLRV